MSRHCFRPLLLTAVLAALFPWGSAADESKSPSPGAPDEFRTFTEALAPDSGNRVQMRAWYVEEEGAPRFVCEVSGVSTISDALLRFDLLDAEGGRLKREEKRISVDGALRHYAFAWDAAAAGVGNYEAQFTLGRSPGVVIAKRDYRVEHVSWARLCGALEHLSGKMAQIDESLAAMMSDGIAAPYARARAGIAKGCLDRAKNAAALGDWDNTVAYVRYLYGAVKGLRAQLTFAMATPEYAEPIPSPDLSTLTIRDGAFYAEGRPVFLMGYNGGQGLPTAGLETIAECGLNLIALSIGPRRTLAGDGRRDSFFDALDPVFDHARKFNVAVAVSLNLPDMPGANSPGGVHLLDDETGGANIESPAARRLIERHVKTLMPYLARQEMLLGVCLTENPRFRFRAPSVRQGFLGEVRARYGDRHALNRAWHALFADMNEVRIGWDYQVPRYQDKPAYQYDWQTYHYSLGDAQIRWLRGLARAQDPDVPLMLAVGDDAFTVGESRYGVDREGVAGQFDVSGCVAGTNCYDTTYAMGYPGSRLTYALLRSFEPDKPVFNLSDRLLADESLEAPPTFAYAHSAMWEAAMSGLNASALDMEDRFGRARCLEGYATACLDLNRLGEIVVAFQQTPAEVAVLWSMASKIYHDGDPYLKTAAFAFEGCSFAGHKVRFITEEQCVAGGLDRVKVLVIPEALAVSDAAFGVLKDYMQGGHIVVRTATSPIQFDERGKSRRDIISPSQRTVLVSGENLPTEYLHAMDAVMGFGELPDIPRIVNDHKYPLEGVKSRYVELDGQGYLYVLNLRKQAVRCNVVGERRSGRDLIRGRDVQFPTVLEPLDPMLIRLDAPVPQMLAEGGE
ncbi:MAG: hypothetical protein GWP08_02930 [Nitrospiraceae bacterium]|nr:hypothetical protein [Nitrospiraceae bacterium]